MAAVTHTMQTYDQVGIREDLHDIIENLTPKEVPFKTMIGRRKVENTRTEWQTDSLATPDETNAQKEGDEFVYDEVSPTVRVANHTQISRKTLVVSKTADAVRTAGRDKETAYQIAKRGAELNKDMEAILLANQASFAGDSNTARKLAGLPAWLETNALRGGGGSDGGWNGSTVSAATNGAQRAFSKPLLDEAIQSVYSAGGNPSVVMVSPYNKTVFSGFMSDSDVAQFRYDATGKKQGAIMAAADMYISDFGTLTVTPNRVMGLSAARARNVFVLDPSMCAVGYLRPIQTVDPAVTGDATKKVLITEYTLIVKNEAGLGVIADTYGLTASS